MVGRNVLIASVLATVSVGALPAAAGEMKADEARRFVVGKVFSFNCFEGSSGAGRILDDGSVSGVVRFGGAQPARYVALPANTLRVRGDSVCASVKGVPFEPCFNLVQTSQRSFRGSISGMSFAYCQFTRRGGRAELVHTTSVHHPDATVASSEKE
jgi:hypothetical protein